MDRRLEAERLLPRTLLALAALALAVALLGVLLLALWSGPADAATTFTVNKTGNARDINISDTRCDSSPDRGNQCTLRAAIQESNDTTGADTINFNIVSDASVKTIKPASALPTITEAVTINGYTQPEASPNTLAEGNDAVLKVQLNGTNAGSANGLVIQASDSTVKGLVINRFAGNGILLSGSGATGNFIEGNFIGTNASGSAAPGNGDDGVDVFGADDNTIGGTAAGARNVISGNGGDGVQIIGGLLATGNEVLGNFIGTNATGNAALGNSGEGVEISQAEGNTIGGTTAAARNIISGNVGDGVVIFGSDATGNKVQGNFIGSGVSGNALGNDDGVAISSGSDSTIGSAIGSTAGGNRIAHNDQDGVLVFGGLAVGNRVLSNSIFSNGETSIDLGGGTEDPFEVTANDEDDPDATTPASNNHRQNFPVITSAIRSNTTNFTTIQGTLNSNPAQNYTIQCFVAAPDPSGHGEGQILVAQTTAATDANGDGGFSCVSPVPQAGQAVTATATNTSGTASGTAIGDTSEFSLNVGVVPGP
jgi:hypothetical protein